MTLMALEAMLFCCAWRLTCLHCLLLRHYGLCQVALLQNLTAAIGGFVEAHPSAAGAVGAAEAPALLNTQFSCSPFLQVPHGRSQTRQPKDQFLVTLLILATLDTY